MLHYITLHYVHTYMHAYIHIDKYIYIWVNYNLSLPWILRPFGDDSPIKTMIPARENSEVAIIYPDI